MLDLEYLIDKEIAKRKLYAFYLDSAIDEYSVDNYSEALNLFEFYLQNNSIDKEGTACQYLTTALKANDSNVDLSGRNNNYIKLKELNINFRTFKPDYILSFGKYKNKKLKNITFKDPKYVLWCIINVDFFSVNCTFLVDDLFSNQNDYFKAIEINLMKLGLIRMKEYEREEAHIRDKEANEDAREAFNSLKNQENDWMEGDSSNYWNID